MRHCLRVFCGLYLGYPTESTKVVNSSHGGYCLTRPESRTAWERVRVETLGMLKNSILLALWEFGFFGSQQSWLYAFMNLLLCKNRLTLNGTRWRVVLEWALGLIRAQNGDLELGKFGPHHFHTLYTHISQIMQKIKFSKKIAWDYISTRTSMLTMFRRTEPSL